MISQTAQCLTMSEESVKKRKSKKEPVQGVDEIQESGTTGFSVHSFVEFKRNDG